MLVALELHLPHKCPKERSANGFWGMAAKYDFLPHSVRSAAKRVYPVNSGCGEVDREHDISALHHKLVCSLQIDLGLTFGGLQSIGTQKLRFSTA
jgi:hypothetical protein